MNEFSGKLPAPLKKNTAVSRKVLNVNKKLNKQRTRTCHASRWPSPASLPFGCYSLAMRRNSEVPLEVGNGICNLHARV